MKDGKHPLNILVLFGTRPECIKLAPVIKAIQKAPELSCSVVSSSQHDDLLRPFLTLFDIQPDKDLAIMRPGQSPIQVLSRVLDALEPILEQYKPDMLLVQGDTTTALAGALSAFHRQIPVGHVEAGLRSGNALSPFPEEMNRRLISRIATLNFAATNDNVSNLRAEGVPTDTILLTGNPVVDALHWILEHRKPSAYIEELLEKFTNRRLIVLTTHRRENFGDVMESNLRAIRDFVNARNDCSLLFPVHPNPSVRKAALDILGESEQVNLIDPLNYADFIHLLSAAWLIVSDSGGVQEEAPSLAKPLIVLRENTERPEVIKAGVAKLAGIDSQNLTAMLIEAEQEGSWIESIDEASDLFGSGDAGSKITEGIIEYFK